MKWIFSLVFGIFIAIQCPAQDQYILHSDFLNQPDTIWVFSPENQNPEASFPLLYLLHGWSGYYHHWDDMIDCQDYANRYGFIVVCPDGLHDSWYLDSPVAGENQYEQFFEKDLIPFINDHYSVQEKNIFISGLSMGGHGALYLFLKNPDYFKGAGSLSGLLDLHGWGNQYGIDRVLGISDTTDINSILNKYSVSENFDQLAKANKPLIISCGTEDPFYEINVNFVEKGKTNQLDIRFIESPGGHNSAFWSSAVKAHFEFFQELAK